MRRYSNTIIYPHVNLLLAMIPMLICGGSMYIRTRIIDCRSVLFCAMNNKFILTYDDFVGLLPSRQPIKKCPVGVLVCFLLLVLIRGGNLIVLRVLPCEPVCDQAPDNLQLCSAVPVATCSCVQYSLFHKEVSGQVKKSGIAEFKQINKVSLICVLRHIEITLFSKKHVSS